MEIAQLEAQAGRPEFWDDPQAAQPQMIRLAEIKDVADAWRDLESRASSTCELIALALEEGDTSLEETLFADLDAISEELKDREFQLTLSGEYDTRNAILAALDVSARRRSQPCRPKARTGITP